MRTEDPSKPDEAAVQCDARRSELIGQLSTEDREAYVRREAQKNAAWARRFDIVPFPQATGAAESVSKKDNVPTKAVKKDDVLIEAAIEAGATASGSKGAVEKIVEDTDETLRPSRSPCTTRELQRAGP